MSLFQFLVVSRWIYFAAVFVLFGAPLFWAYAGETRLPQTLRATTTLLRIAAPLTALSGIAWLVGILANMADGFGSVVDPATLHAFFFETQFGPIAITRLILFLAAIVVAVEPLRQRSFLLALLIIAALLLVSQAWLGHAAEGGAGAYGAIMIIVYSLHVLAGAAWVGGLPVLFLALAETRRLNHDDAGLRTFAILSRYSMMGMIAVSLIVLSGIANAGFRVAGAFDRLFWTAYGTVLVAKVAVVAVMLVLACFNRFVAMPRLRQAAAKDGGDMARLRASVAAELALGVLVLGIAAVLGITPPPR